MLHLPIVNLKKASPLKKRSKKWSLIWKPVPLESNLSITKTVSLMCPKCKYEDKLIIRAKTREEKQGFSLFFRKEK